MRLVRLILLFLLLASPAIAEEYYIGHWEWCSDTDGGDTIEYWCAPQKEFLTGVIDLRSLPQQAQAGGTPQGWAIFSYSQPVSSPDLFNLSDNLDKKLNNPTISKIETDLGITLQATTVREALWEILTLHGDPTGQTKWKPLMPDSKRMRKLNFGENGTIKKQSFNMFETKGWELVLATIQEDYRNMLKDTPHTLIAKWLDFNEDKYGVSYGWFIPDETFLIASLPHETTFTESWDCADSDSLNCDVNWTEVSNDIDIASNEAFEPTYSANSVLAFSDTALSSADNYAQADAYLSGAGNIAGISFRADGTSTYYRCFLSASPTEGGTDSKLQKVVSGTVTDLLPASANNTTSTWHTVYGEADSDQISCKIDNVHESGSPVTDTSISSGLYVGIFGYSPQNKYIYWDNFSAGDLSAGGVSPPFGGSRFKNMRMMDMRILGGNS